MFEEYNSVVISIGQFHQILNKIACIAVELFFIICFGIFLERIVHAGLSLRTA